MAINKNKVQLQETVLDSNGHPLSSTDVNPLTSSDCVIMENGMTLEDVMGNDTVIDTPTIMNEDTSFRAGIGDSETKVIDSDVAKMVIEGKTYQNILPKPTTLIMNTDEKEFKINDKIDSSIVLDDNVAEIATIKGQTYVNVVQEESASEYVAIDEELNGQSITTTGKPEGMVKNATLEGLTLVNTIQEPSGADATVLELDTDIDAQYATIDNTVQGGIHGAFLKGQTLVNISTQKSSNTFTFQSAYNGATPNRQVMAVASSNGNTLTKPSTRYIVKFTVSNYINNYGGSVPITILDYDIYSVVKTTQVNGNGDYYIIGVTKETLGHEGRILIKSNATLFENNTETEVSLTISNIMVLEYQEGMENWDIPYFEGMQSVEVPSIKTTGKNICDMVGLANTLNKIDNKIVVIDESTWEMTSTPRYHNVNFKYRPIKFKENTSYTISFEGQTTDDSRTTLANIIKVIYIDGTESNMRSIGFNKVTTPSNKTIDHVRFSYGVLGVKESISNLSIVEGESTSYEPYKSSTLTTSKIQLTETMFEQGSFAETTPSDTMPYNGIKTPSGSQFFYTNRIRTITTHKVIPGASYNVKINNGYGIFICFCKNGLYSKIFGTGWYNANITFTVPTDCDEMFFALHKVDDSDITVKDYADMGLEIYREVALRKVGDVQDELDLETGKLTQRIGEIVLDGSEDWKISEQTRPNHLRLYLFATRFKEEQNVINDKFADNGNMERRDIEGIYITNTIDIQVEHSRLSEISVDGFKNWLRENNIKVQARLSQESIKTVDLTIQDQDNNPIKSIQTHPTLTHITTSSNGLVPFVTIPSQLKYPTIIKPSTTYTVQLKQITSNSEFPLTINLGGTTMAVPSTKFTITTPETLTSQDVIFTGKNNVIGEVVITEGDTTGIEYGFFEGMNDVKSPSMYATGKNLFDRTKLSDGKFTTFNGKSVYQYIDGGINFKYNSKFKENTQYTFIGKIYRDDENASMKVNFNFYYTDGTRTVNNVDQGSLFTLTSAKDKTIDYISGSYNFNRNAYLDLEIAQLEEGATATSYEPYKGVTIEQDIDSIPLTSDMFEQVYYDYDKIIKGMSLQQLTKQDSNICLRSNS